MLEVLRTVKFTKRTDGSYRATTMVEHTLDRRAMAMVLAQMMAERDPQPAEARRWALENMTKRKLETEVRGRLVAYGDQLAQVHRGKGMMRAAGEVVDTLYPELKS